MVGGRYQELVANDNGRLWSQQLELYVGIHESKLRLFTPQGELIPAPEEAAEQERQQKEQERQEKEQAQQQLAEMAALLAHYRERFGELPE